MNDSIHKEFSLADSSARTATGTGTAVNWPQCSRVMAVILDATALDTDAGDLLDVYVQTKIAGTWYDVIRFARLSGTDAATKVGCVVNVNEAEGFIDPDNTLSAGTSVNLLGDQVRARWVVTDAGDDNATFTFSITAVPLA